nr:zinc ribbon domain-containing protein [Lachnospiraceae bacterium]
MNCPRCGKTVAEGQRFCNSCGAPLSMSQTGGAQNSYNSPGPSHYQAGPGPQSYGSNANYYSNYRAPAPSQGMAPIQ